MPLAPDIIARPGPLAIPYTYELGATEQLRAVSAFAHWDGTGASGAFLPCLSFYDASGNLFMRVFPSTSVAQGGTADVTYAPFPSAGLGGGGGGGGTRLAQVRLETPDSGGNGYAALTLNNGLATIRRIVPAFQHSLDGTWLGSVEVPADYASGATILLAWEANATTGNLRHNVASSVVAAGSFDAALTAESFLNTTVPGTALHRFTTSFVLSTTPAAGDTLLVQVERNGSSGSDTLAVDALLWGCALQYTATY